ncbi:MAG: tRNA (guanosine(46)-N7)-methyltransferase TrmB [Thermaurantimonas sp.]
MAKKKLKKFAENATYSHYTEVWRHTTDLTNYPLRGRWVHQFFGNDNPLVLELGCGKGHYTVGLARRFPDKNFLGIDVKGARINSGCRIVANEKLTNAGFLRAEIELIDRIFAPSEISEIWITFPDPQIKHRRAKHRLTHPDFLQRYRHILKPDGQIHLKTDSEFLHGYTCGILQMTQAKVLDAFYDIDLQAAHSHPLLFEIQTEYEQLFRSEGKKITYLRWSF